MIYGRIFFIIMFKNKKGNQHEFCNFTLKIEWSMRLWRSVNTSRGFLFTGGRLWSPLSLRLQAAIRNAAIRWYSGSWSHFFILRKVSRPLFNLLQGFGLRRRSERVPCERQSTRWAKIACGIEYRFSSAVIFAATALVSTWIQVYSQLHYCRISPLPNPEEIDFSARVVFEGDRGRHRKRHLPFRCLSLKGRIGSRDSYLNNWVRNFIDGPIFNILALV